MSGTGRPTQKPLEDRRVAVVPREMPSCQNCESRLWSIETDGDTRCIMCGLTDERYRVPL